MSVCVLVKALQIRVRRAGCLTKLDNAKPEIEINANFNPFPTLSILWCLHLYQSGQLCCFCSKYLCGSWSFGFVRLHNVQNGEQSALSICFCCCLLLFPFFCCAVVFFPQLCAFLLCSALWKVKPRYWADRPTRFKNIFVKIVTMMMLMSIGMMMSADPTEVRQLWGVGM